MNNNEGAKSVKQVKDSLTSWTTTTRHSHAVKNKGAGEMAQRLRAWTALPEVMSSIPSNHMMVHNHLQRDLIPSCGEI